jgi:arylsulfatase A-like enzyme
MGTFPTTYMSVPAFLSGRVYRNETPMRRFVLEVNRGKTIFNTLHDRGYETHLIEAAQFIKGSRHSQEYQIAVPYGGTERQNLRSKSAQLFDLTLFRHVPHFLKRFIYNDQTWLIQRIIAPKGDLLNLEYFSHAAFMDDVINKMSAKRAEPVYTYIHLMTSHFPIVVNEDCEYAGRVRSPRESIQTQARCVFRQVLRFMERLEAAGIYDSSLIIIQSDHGRTHDIVWADAGSPGDGGDSIGGVDIGEIAGASLSLLLVKPPQDTQAFRVSEAQVSLTDIPATLDAALGLDADFGGRPVFEVDPAETRERRFLFHEWGADDWRKRFFRRLDEFIVTGSVTDRNSWRLDKTHYPQRGDH